MLLRCLFLSLFLGLLTPALFAQWCDSQGALVRFDHASNSGRDIFQIHVVVHIVYRNEDTNISDEQVHSQIEVLNQDFRAMNQDLDLVTLPTFQFLIADTEIEFVLANVDSEGNPSTGIFRTQTDIVNIASTFDQFGRRQIAYTELGGSDAWNTDCILNIWVGEFNEGIAGLGTFPGSVDEAEDGIYISYDRFGTIGTATAPYDKGRTTTHEIGHYLGLQHLWGNQAIPPQDCSGSDGITDTNNQSKTYLGECPTGNQPTCGSFDMYMNFMSLANDPCLVMFTKGQKNYMRNILMQERPGLVDENISMCIVDVTNPLLEEKPLLQHFFARGSFLEGTFSRSSSVQLYLYDLNGQLLNTLSDQRHSFRINMQDLPAGIYILQAQDNLIKQSVKVLYLK